MKKIPNSVNYATSEKVIEYFESKIIHGQLHKGDKLPTERALAEELGVSRATVREAMRAMDTMGIVCSIQGSGNYITDEPEKSVNRAMCALFALNDGTLDNLLQLRILLEVESFKDAVKYASDEELNTVKLSADYNYDVNISEQMEFDRKFHGAIVNLSRNTLLRYFYVTLSSLIDVYRRQVLTATREKDENHITRQDHFEIAEALCCRDFVRAETALRRHLELSDEYTKMLKVTYSSICD